MLCSTEIVDLVVCVEDTAHGGTNINTIKYVIL